MSFIYFYRKHYCSINRDRNLITHYHNSGKHLSEYEINFRSHKDLKRRPLFRPPGTRYPLSKNKMATETTAAADFVPHPIAVQHVRAPVKYKTPEGKMDITSVYKQEFQGKWGEPAEHCKPPPKIEDAQEIMDLVTTHAKEYRRKELPRRNLSRTPVKYRPPEEKVNLVTTAHNDFVDHGRVETLSFKPKQEYTKSEQPFVTTTSYRSTFTPLPLPKRLTRSLPEHCPPNLAFNAASTSKSDYCEKPITPRVNAIVQTDNKVFDSNAPFESITSSRQAYQRWAIPVRHEKTADKYRPSSAKLSSETTTRMDYQSNETARPPTSFKPTPKVSEHGQFEGTTTNNTDYIPWGDVKRPEAISHTKKYEPPATKFDATSTFRAHYLGTTQPRTPSLKPSTKSDANTAKLESLTSYRVDYTYHKFTPCPATSLTGNNSEFKLSHEDNQTGHQYFKPAVVSAQ